MQHGWHILRTCQKWMWAYNFQTANKTEISLPRMTLILMTDDIINKVNELSNDEDEEEGIVCFDMWGRVTIDDIELGPQRDGLFTDDTMIAMCLTKFSHSTIMHLIRKFKKKIN